MVLNTVLIAAGGALVSAWAAGLSFHLQEPAAGGFFAAMAAAFSIMAVVCWLSMPDPPDIDTVG
jgi:hypothetical protein